MHKITLAIMFAVGLTACDTDGPTELRAKAAAALADNESRTAEIHLKNLLQQDGSDAQARFQLAGIYMSRGNWTSAEKEFRKALDLGIAPDRITTQLLQAMSYTARPEALLAHIDSLSTPNKVVQASAQYYASMAHEKLGDRKQAIASLGRAIELDPALIEARTYQLRLKALDDDSLLEQSIEALTDLQRQHPEHIGIHLALGELLIQNNQIEAARDVFDRAHDLSPDNLETLTRMAAVRIGQSQFAEAAPLVDKALAMAKNSPLLLTQKSQIEYSRQRFGSALDTASAALAGAPDYSPALAIAAASALAKGSLERAESYANKLHALAPESVEGYQILASILMQQDRPLEVLDLLDPIIQQGAKDATLLSLAGQAAIKTRNPADASRFLKQAVEFAPNDPSQRIYLAMVKLSTGDDVGGLGDLQTAAKMSSASPTASYTLIGQLIRTGQFEKANQVVADLETKQPGRAENIYLTGLIFRAQKNYAAARSSFEQALKVNARLFPAIGQLATIDAAEGKHDQAIARINAFLVNEPENESALLTLARFHASQSGDEKLAIEAIKRARQANPTSIKPLLMLSALQVKVGNPKLAEETLRAGLAKIPKHADLMEALAKVQQSRGNNEQALSTIDKLTASRPNDPAIQFRMAGLRTNLGDFRGALNGYKTVQKLAPSAIEPRVAIAMVHARMGNQLEAISTARKMQRELPKFAAGWLLEGELHRAGNQWDLAAKAYEKGLSLEPNKIAAYFKFDGAMRRAGEGKKADTHLARRLSTQPNNATLHRYAGDVASTRNEYKTALKHYEKAVGIAPRDAVSWNNLAWTQHKLGNQNALKSAEKALALDPESAPTLDTVAGIVANAGQISRAIDLQAKAVSLSPANSGFRLRLATLYRRDGQTELARDTLKKLLEVSPNSADAKLARKLLGDS